MPAEPFLPPSPTFLREPKERFRPVSKGGHRVHQPGSGQFAVGFTVLSGDGHVRAGDVQPEQAQGGIGERDRWYRGSSGGASYREKAGWGM